MTKSAYTLKESKNSGELHLFKGKIPADDPSYKCTSNRTSICERMTKEDSVKNKFSCADEDEARRKERMHPIKLILRFSNVAANAVKGYGNRAYPKNRLSIREPVLH